ncbi:MAG: O-antigen ligase family protein [Xanthobacteraceae bacterium]
MTGFSTIDPLDRAFFVRLADWLALGVAIALPWSTSVTGICIAAWFVILLPTLDRVALRRELATAAGGLPVVLWCLGVLGMFWADVGWQERLAGLGSFHRLLVVPLLLVQFRRSENGIWVVWGFFVSSVTVLIASFALVLMGPTWWKGAYGVPVHDTIFQGTEFLICGFGALGYAALSPGQMPWRKRALLLTLGMLFLVNFGFATTSRIALFTAPVLLLLLGCRLYRWKGVITAGMLAIAVGAAGWAASPVLRERIEASVRELQDYRAVNKATSIGEHLAFLKESWTIITSAPVIGHGTGTIPKEFSDVTAGKTGVSGLATVNPHNQTFAVAIQLGLLGAIVLWAMWLAHLALFRGEGAIAWLGLVAVSENIISSIAHSHLFDFNNGWLYVFSVGVLGGMTLREPVKLSKNLPSRSCSAVAENGT